MKEMKKVSLVLSYTDFHMILFWQFPFLSNIILYPCIYSPDFPLLRLVYRSHL